MKILVVGGTQFFGRQVVNTLLHKGHDVSVLSRGTNPLPSSFEDVRHIRVDRNDENKLSDKLNGVFFDVVFDNIAMHQKHVSSLLAVVDTDQYILMSSGAVYHGKQHISACEYSRHFDTRIPNWTDMMKPLKEQAVPADPQWLKQEAESEQRQYRKGKLECEREAIIASESTGLKYTIFRPPQVEGPWDPTGRTEFFARRVADGNPLIIDSESRGRIFQKVFRDDLADAIVSSIGNEAAYNRIYNIAQEEILSPERYLCVMADCLNVRFPPITEMKRSEIEAYFGQDYSIPIPSPKTLNLRRAREDLNYTSSPYLEWMKQTLDWIFDRQAPRKYKETRARELEVISSL